MQKISYVNWQMGLCIEDLVRKHSCLSVHVTPHDGAVIPARI